MIEINKIYNEDCLDGIKRIDDNSIDCVITDPPYFLGVTHNGKKGNYSDLVIMKPFFDTLFFQFDRVLKADGKMYMCCDWRTYPFLYPVCEQYLPIKNLLVWNKISGPGNEYSFTHEFIIFCSKKAKNTGSQNLFTLKAFNSGAKATNGEKVHPTQKPIELFEKFLLDTTSEGDLILDAFMGSGTTAIACIKNKRNYIGFELQEKYCKIAQERINNYVGDYDINIDNYKNKNNLFNN
jgi:site-specific DNA-methyltransferase (adenine-specific)